MKFTRVFPRIVEAVKDMNDTLILYGGSSSSKTVSIMQYCTIYAYKYPGVRVTFASESMPIIRKTLFPDWCTFVMGDRFDPGSFNKTEMVYNIPNGSRIQFLPGDDPARWHGMRQDICYFDELYYIRESIWHQAEIRTRKLMFGSFNPLGPFWVQELFDRKHTYVDHSTYKDNPFLDQKIIDSLERRADVDENFYRVYVLGEFGTLDGVIFEEGKHFTVVPTADMPDARIAKKHIIAIDFGYSVDPTCIVEIWMSGGEIWIRQHLYKTELTNQDIAEFIHSKWGSQPGGVGLLNIVADSAEPKSIAELQREGLNVKPSVKGRDSIVNGISLMKQFPIRLDKSSLDMVKEFRNYRWAKRPGDDMPLNKPEDNFNHSIDACRYGFHQLFAGRLEFTLY